MENRGRWRKLIVVGESSAPRRKKKLLAILSEPRFGGVGEVLPYSTNGLDFEAMLPRGIVRVPWQTGGICLLDVAQDGLGLTAVERRDIGTD